MLAPVSDKSSLLPWEARLNLSFRCDPTQQSRTQLFHQHSGPLRIQKALYPEGSDLCHAILIHPPGGIAAGDDLGIQMTVDPAARALITTPGAAKWYGSTGQIARQQIEMDIQGDLEWLPQESIIFNSAVVQSAIRMRADKAARGFGWDTLIFGRSACGESFDTGSFRQVLELHLDHQLVWKEQLALQGGDPLFASPIGLRGFHALATCWAIRPAHAAWQAHELAALRSAEGALAWTQLHPRLLVGRALGAPPQLKERLIAAWQVVRPMLFGRLAVPPRLWAT
jgi:urease accessory protein